MKSLGWRCITALYLELLRVHLLSSMVTICCPSLATFVQVVLLMLLSAARAAAVALTKWSMG